MILKTLNTISVDINAEGNIIKMQIQTPRTQVRLMSSELLRLIMCTIIEILKSGMMIPATKPAWVMSVFMNNAFS